MKYQFDPCTYKILVCLWWQQPNASEDKHQDSEKQRGTPRDRWPWEVSNFCFQKLYSVIIEIRTQTSLITYVLYCYV